MPPKQGCRSLPRCTMCCGTFGRSSLGRRAISLPCDVSSTGWRERPAMGIGQGRGAASEMNLTPFHHHFTISHISHFKAWRPRVGCAPGFSRLTRCLIRHGDVRPASVALRLPTMCAPASWSHPMRLASLLLCCLLPLVAFAQAREFPSDPDEARLVTDDLDLFWQAWD